MPRFYRTRAILSDEVLDTPDYIQHLQARGMKNLSIDQMVNLRIHGIGD